ncbi:GMC oxidoreductase [Streptomyces sp. NPDC006283]|uniref:GMC family oxidoreductase n=1 Tax=Streptomyces sp. NPDC006283 TaxID=3156741 RepID=UPI0033B528EA
MDEIDDTHDFVVVGSGAGGGPLAANLAEAGHRVLLLEAGDEHNCPYYDVPLLHARASEDPDMRWDFFVHHYDDTDRRRRDSKYLAEQDGVLYPRGTTLGGSTAVSAMITVYPHHSDWDAIAQLTGDPSWSAQQMRRHVERLESCGHAPPDARARHGHDGWLQVSRANPAVGNREQQWLDIFEAFEQTSLDIAGEPPAGLGYPLDPNDWRTLTHRAEGMAFIPVAVAAGARNGSRERVLTAQRAHPDRLTVRLGALVTRVLFDGDRAVGVEYMDGPHLYRADPLATPAAATVRSVHARREVVLCGGAFNTPQLLKLSGIGPREELAAHGIPLRVDAPGVGENLQDRYEVSVVHKLRRTYDIFDGAAFDAPPPGTAGTDPHFHEWSEQRDGIYSTNGSLAAYLKRSSQADRDPDLFIFALPAHFRGYYPGYAEEFTHHTDTLSWVILKGHTRNRAGSVTLRSADPCDTPEISFRYFQEGGEPDLDAVADGIELVRTMAHRLDRLIDHELVPGPQAATREDLRRFVRDEAWGHHACGTARIGAEHDPMAVLDGDFRVRGTRGLRVVDACVFPSIPGFFLASAVYLISEKASEAVLRDHPT